MDKVIRLVSFQNAFNFGAVLQAFGLQQTIKSLDYNDVKFLNYTPKYLSDRYNPFTKELLFPYRTLKGFISWCIHYPFFLVSRLYRNLVFKRSIRDILDQTDYKIIENVNSYEENVDVLICGSDQIWNTAITGLYDPILLGMISFKHLGYVASYAASTEMSDLSEENVNKLKEYIQNFKYISVREAPVKDILQKYITNDISVCVDPTILCGRGAFDRIASPRIVKKDYIVVYAYDAYDPAILNLIHQIPDLKNYPIHIILLGAKTLHYFFDSKVHSAISVQDFLSYIKYAKYVVTNSFHGLAFSLLFGKNFNVAFCEGKHVRCLSLLQQLGLEERLVYNGNSCNWDVLNYDGINSKIDGIRKESLNYLKEVLRG